MPALHGVHGRLPDLGNARHDASRGFSHQSHGELEGLCIHCAKDLGHVEVRLQGVEGAGRVSPNFDECLSCMLQSRGFESTRKSHICEKQCTRH